MNKKYFPHLALLAAILLFVWIKKNQRGAVKNTNITVQPTSKNTEDFDRSITQIVYSKHARCRMDCRHIDESEVKEILVSGTLNTNKIEEDAKGKTYPLEGITHDKQHVRIVFAPHQNELVVVTVVDLDTEWQCNCN
ncbi:MAG: DUF4258 domain-containing protein [Ferruginibacter sp.]